MNIEYTNGNYDAKRVQSKVISHFTTVDKFDMWTKTICAITFLSYNFQKDVIIGRLPIMLRSCRCVLYGKDEEELAKYGTSMHFLI